ncbi:MAG TPA: RtcB family protein [Thermomicrobiales bacterium]|nr:RtcB family protein [Thermomicrobiales bacterium]
MNATGGELHQIVDSVAVWGDPVDARAVAQAARCLRSHDEAVAAALMADHHVGYSQPIGGVVAYVGAVSPSGVGYDIGCGNTAVRTDLSLDEVGDRVGPIMDEVFERVSFGIGSKSDNRDHQIFDDARWRLFDEFGLSAGSTTLKVAREQLGSVGSGNHYVDIFVDEMGAVWVGVHFGSRGFGHRTASGFMSVAAGRRFDAKRPGSNMDSAPSILRLDDEVGQLYWDAMELAAEYARVGRGLVIEQTLDVLGAVEMARVENNHNMAWREAQNIDGAEVDVVVVRKGATPAFPGQPGFVGGSMGDDALIIRGLDGADGVASMRSTIHGAGRVMSRTQAAGKMNWKTRKRSGGQVTRAMMIAWLDERGVALRGGGTDESPHAYKRLDSVINHHLESVETVHRLRPLGVAMAGEGEHDPYRD